MPFFSSSKKSSAPSALTADADKSSSTTGDKGESDGDNESSAVGKDKDVVLKATRYSDELDVDYDVNCSALYKSIENKQWDAAAARARSHPEEACTWVSRHEVGNPGKLRWRLLPIHATCIFRSPVSLIEALLRAFPDGAQMKDDQGMLPVHLACRNGASKGVVMMLLDSFPESVDLKDRKGRTPLAFAQGSTSQNREAVVLAIRKFVADARGGGGSSSRGGPSPASPSSSRAGGGDGSSVPHEVDYEHRTVLFRLVLKKDWENAALRAKSSPDEASTWIVTKGFKGNLRFLPLHKACVLNPPESVVESLVAAHPEGAKSRDQDGWLPIHCGSFYGAGQGVLDTLLVAYPKGAQCKDDEGRLPIHYACLKGATAGVVESLLGTYPKGAQSKDDEGRLPIHHACSKGAPEGVVAALLNSNPKGAQSKDDQGRLPIHHACRKNSTEKIIKSLLKTYPKGAQVKDDQDKLPIHYVCQNGGSEDVINVLLSAYPNSINVKNGFGYTPLAEAKTMDNPKMEKVVAVLERFKKSNPQLTSDLDDAATARLLDESTKRAKTAERAANEAREEQAVLMRKMTEMELVVKRMEQQISNLSRMGATMKANLAEGVTAREVLEKFGEELKGLKKV